MSVQIPIDLPDDLKAQLAEAAAQDGVSPEQWIARAVCARLRVLRFEKARARVIAELESGGIHLTEEEILEMPRE